MSIFRIYPSKSNTIAGSYFNSLNSGQNAITDLWYGGGGTDTAPEKRNSVSRFLVYFDLNNLRQKLDSKEINESLVTSYKLRMTNSKPGDLVLEDDYEYDILFKKVATSFDLIAFPINKYWEEGRGYDLTKEVYVVRQKGSYLTSGVSNWDYATTQIAWDEPGIYIDPSASTTSYATQHFDIGNEDIDMDVTNIVKDWLSGGSENYGIGIAYRRDYELLSTDTRYISSFFTEKTNTAFKPCLEIVYNQVIQDDRKQISNNRPSNLFLYTFSGHNFANINLSAVTVDIKRGNISVYTGLTPTQLSTGTYYVNVWMSGATAGEKYTDVWNNVSFSQYDTQNIEQTFQIQKNYYTASKPSINEYVLEVYGVEQGKIVHQDEKIRVYCDLRVNYSINKPSTSYSLKYRLIMNNQIEVIPWTEVNQAVIDDCKTNYFDLDASWLLHNQTYQLNFMIDEMGTSRVMPERIDLKVIKPFN
jgi:hypothetical protein